MYPLLEGSSGVPDSVPGTVILPEWNSMAMFTVVPGQSFHSVQEVFSPDKPRLSIQGAVKSFSAKQKQCVDSSYTCLCRDGARLLWPDTHGAVDGNRLQVGTTQMRSQATKRWRH